MLSRNIFVTGTSTGVGKTLVSAWLCLHCGYSYYKPIQTGINTEPADSTTIAQLTHHHIQIHKTIYNFGSPVSPHRAAKEQNTSIDIENIVKPENLSILYEGAGGAMVPINDSYLTCDFIKHLNIPTIIVGNDTLGIISHTLMTIEVLLRRNIKILGIILNNHTKDKDNKNAIEQYGKIPVIATIPTLEKVDYESLMAIKCNINEVLYEY